MADQPDREKLADELAELKKALRGTEKLLKDSKDAIDRLQKEKGVDDIALKRLPEYKELARNASIASTRHNKALEKWDAKTNNAPITTTIDEVIERRFGGPPSAITTTVANSTQPPSPTQSETTTSTSSTTTTTNVPSDDKMEVETSNRGASLSFSSNAPPLGLRMIFFNANKTTKASTNEKKRKLRDGQSGGSEEVDGPGPAKKQKKAEEPEPAATAVGSAAEPPKVKEEIIRKPEVWEDESGNVKLMIELLRKIATQTKELAIKLAHSEPTVLKALGESFNKLLVNKKAWAAISPDPEEGAARAAYHGIRLFRGFIKELGSVLARPEGQEFKEELATLLEDMKDFVEDATETQQLQIVAASLADAAEYEDIEMEDKNEDDRDEAFDIKRDREERREARKLEAEWAAMGPEKSAAEQTSITGVDLVDIRSYEANVQALIEMATRSPQIFQYLLDFHAAMQRQSQSNEIVGEKIRYNSNRNLGDVVVHFKLPVREDWFRRFANETEADRAKSNYGNRPGEIRTRVDLAIISDHFETLTNEHPDTILDDQVVIAPFDYYHLDGGLGSSKGSKRKKRHWRFDHLSLLDASDGKDNILERPNSKGFDLFVSLMEYGALLGGMTLVTLDRDNRNVPATISFVLGIKDFQRVCTFIADGSTHSLAINKYLAAHNIVDPANDSRFLPNKIILQNYLVSAPQVHSSMHPLARRLQSSGSKFFILDSKGVDHNSDTKHTSHFVFVIVRFGSDPDSLATLKSGLDSHVAQLQTSFEAAIRETIAKHDKQKGSLPNWNPLSRDMVADVGNFFFINPYAKHNLLSFTPLTPFSLIGLEDDEIADANNAVLGWAQNDEEGEDEREQMQVEQPVASAAAATNSAPSKTLAPQEVIRNPYRLLNRDNPDEGKLQELIDSIIDEQIDSNIQFSHSRKSLQDKVGQIKLQFKNRQEMFKLLLGITTITPLQSKYQQYIDKIAGRRYLIQLSKSRDSVEGKTQRKKLAKLNQVDLGEIEAHLVRRNEKIGARPVQITRVLAVMKDVAELTIDNSKEGQGAISSFFNTMDKAALLMNAIKDLQAKINKKDAERSFERPDQALSQFFFDVEGSRRKLQRDAVIDSSSGTSNWVLRPTLELATKEVQRIFITPLKRIFRIVKKAVRDILGAIPEEYETLDEDGDGDIGSEDDEEGRTIADIEKRRVLEKSPFFSERSEWAVNAADFNDLLKGQVKLIRKVAEFKKQGKDTALWVKEVEFGGAAASGGSTAVARKQKEQIDIALVPEELQPPEQKFSVFILPTVMFVDAVLGLKKAELLERNLKTVEATQQMVNALKTKTAAIAKRLGALMKKSNATAISTNPIHKDQWDLLVGSFLILAPEIMRLEGLKATQARFNDQPFEKAGLEALVATANQSLHDFGTITGTMEKIASTFKWEFDLKAISQGAWKRSLALKTKAAKKRENPFVTDRLNNFLASVTKELQNYKEKNAKVTSATALDNLMDVTHSFSPVFNSRLFKASEQLLESKSFNTVDESSLELWKQPIATTVLHCEYRQWTINTRLFEKLRSAIRTTKYCAWVIAMLENPILESTEAVKQCLAVASELRAEAEDFIKEVEDFINLIDSESPGFFYPTEKSGDYRFGPEEFSIDQAKAMGIAGFVISPEGGGPTLEKMVERISKVFESLKQSVPKDGRISRENYRELIDGINFHYSSVLFLKDALGGKIGSINVQEILSMTLAGEPEKGRADLLEVLRGLEIVYLELSTKLTSKDMIIEEEEAEEEDEVPDVDFRSDDDDEEGEVEGDALIMQEELAKEAELEKGEELNGGAVEAVDLGSDVANELMDLSAKLRGHGMKNC